MTYDPAASLQVGRDLLDLSAGDPTSEPYFRGSANRSYYSVYGRLRRDLEALHQGLFPGRGRHKELVDKLVGSTDAHVARIGARLNNLKASREMADYDYRSVFSETMAQLSLDKAASALDKVQKLSSGQLQALAVALA